MNKVFYSTPWYPNNIGKGINEFIEMLPEDSWVCIRDSDTLFLTSEQQRQIQDIVDSNPPFDLIGCRTNRLRSPKQAVEGAFDVDSMAWHIELAKVLEKEYYGVIDSLMEPEVVAGMFMLFRKSLWDKVKFQEKTIQFDSIFTNEVRKFGTIGIAQGIYLFHLYRYGAEDPSSEVRHIVNCHDFSN